MIKVVVVEDSAVVRDFLVSILETDPAICVIAVARDGQEALETVRRTQPDVITMDVHMPKLDGLAATRQIMETHPTPIIIVSGSADRREVVTSFQAMEAGALALLPRPSGFGHPDHAVGVRELVRMVKLMAEVKVVRRWPRARRDVPSLSPDSTALAHEPAKLSIVAIGASTGGPPVLQDILKALQKDFPMPIVIVQHIASGFSRGLTEWLSQTSALPVQLGTHGEWMRPGHVYIAPDDVQMKVARQDRIVLAPDEPENNLRPSVSYLFRSVAEVYGRYAVAGLLTGMGRDGAAELRLLKEKGAITFVQDKDTSAVHGMPGEALRLDAATLVLPAGRIAAMLTGLAHNASQPRWPHEQKG